MKNKLIWSLLLSIICLMISCANPLNRATFDRYRQEGFAAEKRGDLGTAEIAFYRAAENVRLGNLGKDHESDSLYNLGRIKRLVGKLDESEDLLKRALEIDEERYGKDGFFTSYTMGELAVTYYNAGKLDDGLVLLNRLKHIVMQHKKAYTDQFKKVFRKMYRKYSDTLSERGNKEEADNLIKTFESF